MRRLRTRISAAALIALLSTVATTLVAQARPLPVTGVWTLRLKADDGTTGTPTATLEQQGVALAGHFSSLLFGDADLKGTVKGSSIVFTVFAQFQGKTEELSFQGDYDGDNSIKGIYSNNFGNGTFTATRKPPTRRGGGN